MYLNSFKSQSILTKQVPVLSPWRNEFQGVMWDAEGRARSQHHQVLECPVEPLPHSFPSFAGSHAGMGTNPVEVTHQVLLNLASSGPLVYVLPPLFCFLGPTSSSHLLFWGLYPWSLSDFLASPPSPFSFTLWLLAKQCHQHLSDHRRSSVSVPTG